MDLIIGLDHLNLVDRDGALARVLILRGSARARIARTGSELRGRAFDAVIGSARSPGATVLSSSKEPAGLFPPIHPAQALGFPEHRQSDARGDDDTPGPFGSQMSSRAVSAATGSAS